MDNLEKMKLTKKYNLPLFDQGIKRCSEPAEFNLHKTNHSNMACFVLASFNRILNFHNSCPIDPKLWKFIITYFFRLGFVF